MSPPKQPQSAHLDTINEPLISGPHSFFQDSFLISFFKPAPWRNSSMLIKATYKMSHEMWKDPSTHQQIPPLHLHFDQAETILVTKGKVELTIGYSLDKVVVSSTDTEPHIIPTMLPHVVGPPVRDIVDGRAEDVEVLVWAHPPRGNWSNGPCFLLQPLQLMFQGQQEEDMGILMMLMQESATAGVIMPHAWWLGSLRWRIPYAMQGVFSLVAKWQGKKPYVEEYSKIAGGKKE